MLKYLGLAFKSPEDIEKFSQKQVLKAFQYAADNVPAYRELLKERGVEASDIQTIEDFRAKVPIIGKKETFTANAENIDKLCVNGNIDELREILASSGFSRADYSFGLSTRKDLVKSAVGLERMFNYIFNIKHTKTLFVNALSMGVRVPLRPESRIVTVDTGPRYDTVLATIKYFGKYFAQIIILGENYFLKQLLEEAVEQGVDFSGLNIRIILGGEFFPESFRSYLLKLLDKDLDSESEMIMGSSCGVSEIGLNLFFETRNTVLVRQKAQDCLNVRRIVFGGDTPFIPQLFKYDPTRIYVEEVDGQLVITALDKDRLVPLVRYATGDRGTVLSCDDYKGCLERADIAQLYPKEPFPFVIFESRDKYVSAGGDRLYPETVKELIYQDPELAGAVTGYFRIKKTIAGIVMEIQLKEDVNIEQAPLKRLKEEIFKASRIKVKIKPVQFIDFNYGLTNDMQRKFNYIG